MSTKPAGGIKGFLQKTGKFGIWAFESGNSLAQWTYRYGGKAAYILATTSMVVLMPLLFEITREGQVRFLSGTMIVLRAGHVRVDGAPHIYFVVRL